MKYLGKRMKCLDLFSGKGGFSEGFRKRGHEVTRYDFNKDFEEVPHTIIKDVFDLTADDLQGADIILASIDCTYLTYANPQPDPKALLESLSLAQHTLKIIQEAHPKFWVIENPPGRLKHVLGPPVIKTAWGFWGTPYLKPTWLWGILPFMIWPTRYTEPEPNPEWDLKKYKHNKFAYLAKRQGKDRSFIPLSFSEALCIAAENDTHYQTTLTRPEIVEGSPSLLDSEVIK